MSGFLHESETYRLPRPAQPAISPATFALCPVGMLGGLSPLQLLLYQLAYEQARQSATPSLPERDLAAVWN
jgi:hypothetical protein